MYIEHVTLTNFRCFGSDPVRIELDPELTAMIGANGAGKTAALEALMRLFGVSQEQRRIRSQDFHVPPNEVQPPQTRTLSIDVVLAFPELADQEEDKEEQICTNQKREEIGAIPDFFLHMSATEEGQLKCRIRLQATWTSDGSIDGAITESPRLVRTLCEEYGEDDWSHLSPADRSRIQMIYLPAVRDGGRLVTAFLKSRMWRAARWSDALRNRVEEITAELDLQFHSEPVVDSVETALRARWQELYTGGTDANPRFQPVDQEFATFVGRSSLLFEPTETGQERRADELSDGQRSLLHIALTAATLDVEEAVSKGDKHNEFDVNQIGLPTLTILAVEEPENSLAPFYLSRIVDQMLDVAGGHRCQALIASHSASVLGRLEPEAVRHFRLDTSTRIASVRRLSLPVNEQDEGKYVREAVRAYPELYFARFVVLGEGSSEEIALPILAEAQGVPIDRSFVAVVPLGGRHVHHLWRLLKDLRIPYATLLDLDRGRSGGGKGRIRTTCEELLKIGRKPFAGRANVTESGLINCRDDNEFEEWLCTLRQFDVYFCAPLDLDMLLMRAYADDYKTLAHSQKGPGTGDASSAVLGEQGEASLYEGWDEDMRWYRYLFLGRSKPSTHLQVLSRIPSDRLRGQTPEVLRALIEKIKVSVI